MKYADWLTKDQAAKLIGVSVKTLERYAAERKIEQKLRPRPGGSPLAVFNPQDVERLASERAAAEGRPFVMPASPQSETVPALRDPVSAPASLVQQFEASLVQQLEAIAAAVKPLHVSPGDKVRVTTAEAMALGFTRDNLRELMKAGKLENVGTARKHRFRRRDLDAL